MFWFLAAALLLTGCAADLSGIKASPGVREAAVVEGLKAFEQEPDQCAAAALATLLAWAAPPGEKPEALVPCLYNPARQGAFAFDLAREARLRGLLAYSPTGGLGEVLAETAAGRPVAVLENRGLAFYGILHWSVVAGYDLNAREITLLEGRPNPVTTSLDTFSRTFARSGSVALLALPPPLIPVNAPPNALLAAINELAAAGGASAALPFFRSFASRYPNNWLGRFALGNALHKSGDGTGAEKELQAAEVLAPERPEPKNNLALLALAAGRREEARKYAREAVSAARAQGMAAARYEETLLEVGGEE